MAVISLQVCMRVANGVYRLTKLRPAHRVGPLKQPFLATHLNLQMVFSLLLDFCILGMHFGIF